MIRDMSADIAEPVADDPDTPTEAVGSWPTIDLARLGLPPLGWVFVAAALFVGAVRLRTLSGAPFDIVPGIVFSAVEAAVVVLLPAALLWRVHDAMRTHALLLTGLALVAVDRLILAMNQLWPMIQSDDGTRSAVGLAWPWLMPAGGVLIGLGLLRLRTGPIRLPVLATIVAVYVGIGVASYLIGAGSGTLDAYDAALLIIVPVGRSGCGMGAGCSVAGVGHAAGIFWGLLAIALPLGVIARLLTLVATIVATSTQSNVMFVPTVTVNSVLGCLAALLALVAYARMTPRGDARGCCGGLDPRMHVSQRVAGRIARDFRGEHAAQALDLLFSLDLGGTSPEGAERICGALAIIADGDIDRLIEAAAAAEIDWRDTLVSGGLENDDWRDRLDAALATTGRQPEP